MDLPHLQDIAVSINDKEPTIDEIKFAIRQLKTGKTAEPDQVIAEAIKAGGKHILSQLRLLLRMIWHSDNIPNSWKNGLIVPLFKKGDNGECKNYRGISLLSAVGKVFMKVIQQRLQQKREQEAREEQTGFLPEGGGLIKYSYYDNCSKDTCNVERDSLSCSLILPPHSIGSTDRHYGNHWLSKECLLRSSTYYSRYTKGQQIAFASMEEHPNTSMCIPGFRQGCVSSPILFNTVVDAIMRIVFADRRSVQFSDNDYITDLTFADDSLIFANTETEASAIIHEIKNAAYSYGLTINADKTKLFTSDGSRAIINLDNVQLEGVQHFKYLASIAEEQKIAATTDITTRIGQAAAAFGALTWCFWHKSNINISTKM